jgi:hypothetical protein
MIPFLILPILNLLGINAFPGQDAFSATVPFDKNKHYSVSALSLLCCCIMITNTLRKNLLWGRVPFPPLKIVGLASLATCLFLSTLVLIDTVHRIQSMAPNKSEESA